MKIKSFLILICVAFVFVSCFGTSSKRGVQDNQLIGYSPSITYSDTCPSELPEGCTCDDSSGSTAYDCTGGCDSVTIPEACSCDDGHIECEGEIVTSTVATPTIAPQGGEYANGTSISIAADDGATIYYTTNGNEPQCSNSSSLYNSPLTLTQSMTLKAIACKANYNDSSVRTEAYTLASQGPVGTVVKPTYSFVDSSGNTIQINGTQWAYSGTYPKGTRIKIATTTTGSTIYYTTNGTEPKCNTPFNGTLYTNPFVLNVSPTTLKAKACKTNYEDSGVRTETFKMPLWLYFASSGEAVTSIYYGKGNVGDVYANYYGGNCSTDTGTVACTRDRLDRMCKMRNTRIKGDSYNNRCDTNSKYKALITFTSDSDKFSQAFGSSSNSNGVGASVPRGRSIRTYSNAQVIADYKTIADAPGYLLDLKTAGMTNDQDLLFWWGTDNKTCKWSAYPDTEWMSSRSGDKGQVHTAGTFTSTQKDCDDNAALLCLCWD